MSSADDLRQRAEAARVAATPTGAVAAVASDATRLLLDLDPVLGDHATQVVVDEFVEQAARALEALARAVQRCT